MRASLAARAYLLYSRVFSTRPFRCSLPAAPCLATQSFIPSLPRNPPEVARGVDAHTLFRTLPQNDVDDVRPTLPCADSVLQQHTPSFIEPSEQSAHQT